MYLNKYLNNGKIESVRCSSSLAHYVYVCTYLLFMFHSILKNSYLIFKEVLITKLVMKMINVLTRFCVLYVVKCTFMDVQQERRGAF